MRFWRWGWKRMERRLRQSSDLGWEGGMGGLYRGDCYCFLV